MTLQSGGTTESGRVFSVLMPTLTNSKFGDSFLLTCQLSLHGDANTVVVVAADGGDGLRPSTGF